MTTAASRKPSKAQLIEMALDTDGAIAAGLTTRERQRPGYARETAAYLRGMVERRLARAAVL